MTQTGKLQKLIYKLQALSRRLEKTRELAVHRQVNHFYYMQKAAELMLLQEQFEETQHKLSMLTSRINEQYGCVFCHWRRDIRWLQHFERLS